MGLAVCIGVLSDLVKEDEDGAASLLDQFRLVNDLLIANGVEPFEEPDTLPELRGRCPINGYPYSFLHYLRRVAAIRANEPDFIAEPLGEDEEPHSPWIEIETEKLTNHLLCHSDADGYYVPKPFKIVLFAEPDSEISGGGIVGSSYSLRDDLVAVAPALKITLSDGELSESEASRISEIIESESPLWIEHLVWFDLFEASRLSIKHGTAIVFA
jgi:hypothetical protein